MDVKALLQNFIEQKLEEMKQPYAVVDTADGNRVVATASDEKGAKQSIASSERPPMSIKDKNTLKIVKTRKKQAIGHPLVEEVVLDERVEVDHSRYMRSHGKKARGRGMWMFTSKDMGSPSNDEMVTVNGDLASAAKEAAKKLGTNRVYVMEEVELTEDIHNDLNDAIIDFQKKLMRMTRQLDPAIAKEVKSIDKSLDNLRTGPLFKVRPGR
jgi:hypothetical protein